MRVTSYRCDRCTGEQMPTPTVTVGITTNKSVGTFQDHEYHFCASCWKQIIDENLFTILTKKEIPF